ncbi:cytochrome P450 6B5-like [Amyelois transitella]|uniref:cytochrome P450 6B5-like n=1 Tax=Amyelois transitella TaxID=680683 RepID=UPI00298F6A46|nr:cytochrome P450 6B5-like [Amyelois transitella]
MIVLLLLSISLILIYVYLNGKYNENYWKERGAKFYEVNKVLGPFWEFLISDRPLFQIFHDIYKKHPNEPAIGIGTFFTPSLYVTDAKNVHAVMQTDFVSFSERGFEMNEGDLLADNILFMGGKRWKLMRQNMTPLFTAAKLKNMYYIIDKSALDFVEHLKNNPEKWRRNTFDTLSTFCCAAIGGAVFGIGSESTYDSPFLEITRAAFRPTLWSNIRFSLSNLCTPLFKLLGLKLFSEHEEFFIGAIKQVLRKREQEKVKRHDFADICIQIQKNGVMRDESGYELLPSDELLAAQAFFFFTAGVEPTATAIFAVLIQLGKHPNILKQVVQEIEDVYNKYNAQLSYDAIGEMEYLDKVFNESLRIFPPIGFLTRKCVRDTVLPVGNIKVAKGTKMYTAVYELHHDSRYHENPEMFDPERNLTDQKSETYLPFGKGGRICIGARYAKLQAKAALAHVLRSFDIKTVEHKGGLRFGKDQVQLRMKNVDIEFIPRN